MRVRERTDADLAACAALLLRVREATGYPVRRPEDPVAWIRDVGRAWVAELDGALVGHVALTLGPGGSVVVERLYVDPDRSRGGIGSLLLRTAVDAARLQGLSPVLETLDRPGGPLPFYEKLGWRETNRHHVEWTEHELVQLTLRP